MVFIGFEKRNDGVRIYLECTEAHDAAGNVAATRGYPIDVIFNEPGGVRFEGVNTVYTLRKFAKLVATLEERARERSGDREFVFRSVGELLELLRLLKNAREFEEPRPADAWGEAARESRWP